MAYYIFEVLIERYGHYFMDVKTYDDLMLTDKKDFKKFLEQNNIKVLEHGLGYKLKKGF